MKKFNFNLQRLLDYRETVEESLLAELAAIQADHAREAARLIEIASLRDLYKLRMKEHLTGSDADEIRQAYNYLQELSLQVYEQELSLREIEEKKDQKTAEVVEAAKDRKVLERLRQFKVAEHKKLAEYEEQKFLDDIACIRHGRMGESDSFSRSEMQ